MCGASGKKRYALRQCKINSSDLSMNTHHKVKAISFHSALYDHQWHLGMTVAVTQPTVPSSCCIDSAIDHLSLLGDDLMCGILTLSMSLQSCFLHCG